MKRLKRPIILIVGRWQVPHLHAGHVALIENGLSRGDVVVGIRDTKRDDKNPYSYRHRRRIIRDVFEGSVKIMRFPDISEVLVGRDVGYTVAKFDESIEAISGTAMRAEATEKNRK